MFFNVSHRWTRNFKQGTKRRRPSSSHLEVELLEARVVPAFNLTISTSATNAAVTHTNGSFTATATGANINVADIRTDLLAGKNVTISNGSTGAETGTITWQASSNLDYNGIGTTGLQLTITADASTQAGAQLVLNSSILDSNPATPDSLSVTLNAGTHSFTSGSSGAISAGSGSVTVTADTITGIQAAITANGGITLQPKTAGTTIGLNDPGGTFNLTAAELNLLSSTGSVTIGAANAGAVTIAGSGAITLGGSGYNLTILGGDTTVNGAITTGSGNLSLNAGTHNFTSGASGTINAGSGSVTVTANTIGNPINPFQGTITANGGITLQPNTAGTTIGLNDPAGTFNLTIDELNLLSSTGTVTLGAANAGAVTIGGSGTLTLASGYNLTIRGGLTTFSDLLYDPGTETLTLATGAITNNAVNGSGGVILDPTGILGFITSGSVGSSAKPLDIEVSNLGASTVTGSLFLSTSTDLTTTGTVSATGANAALNFTLFGDFTTHSGNLSAASTTLAFNGFSGGNALQQSLTTNGQAITNLVHGGDIPLLVLDNLTVTNFTNQNGAGDVDITNRTVNVSGTGSLIQPTWSWGNSGSLLSNFSTVVFNGVGQWIGGNTSFYNLTKTVTSPDTLTFQAGSSQLVTGVLTLTGTTGKLLSLRSSAPGTQWNLNAQGFRNVSFVDVQDSFNTNAVPLTAASSSNSGNNTNWIVSPTNTMTVVMTSGSPSIAGQLVAFTATVTAVGAPVTPTGVVSFLDGSTLLGTSTVSGGFATLSTTFVVAGSHSITAVFNTNANFITSTSPAITQQVNPGAATHFLVTPATGTPTAGAGFNVMVTAQDPFNNTATGYGGTVHVTSSDGQFVPPANGPLTSGVGTFNVTLKTAGSQTVSATDTVTSSITGTSTVAVSPAGIMSFAVSAPPGIVAGTTFNITVTAQDLYGNTVPTYAGTVKFSTTAAFFTLPPNSSLTRGMGTFPVILFTAGNQTVTATDTVNSGLNGSSGTIVVIPTADPTFTVSAPTTFTAGAQFTFTVTAHDEFNNTVTQYIGTVHFSSSDPGAMLPGNMTLTNGTGMFPATLKTAGPQTVTATDTSNPTITGSTTVTVTPGAVNKLVFATLPSNPAAGAALSPVVTVLIEDQFGNLESTDSTDHVTVGIASGPGTFSSGSTTTVTASAGSATFSNLHLNTAGNYTLSETATGGLTGPASSSFTVTPGAVNRLAVTALSSSITAGTGLGLIVTAVDGFNNPTSDTGTVTFTSNDPQAAAPVSSLTTLSGGTAFAVATLKTATATGWTIMASDSTSHSGTVLVMVTPAAASHFSVSAAAVTTSVHVAAAPSGASESGATVTINTTTPHGFTVGQSVNLAGFVGAASGYNGTVQITSVTPTSFTYTALANHLGLPASGGGTVTSVATTGSAFNVVVTALDPFGNTATAYNGMVQLSSSDGAASFPVNNYTFTTTGGTPDNGVHTFSATLNTPGTSQTITATDTSNASIVGSISGGVFTVGLYMTAFATTASGFTATFNKLLNSSQLDYYRFSGQPVPPDISMTVGSSTTTVNGSVVVTSTATQTTLIFVNTGGPLTLNQAYTVTLGSGSNGIQDTNLVNPGQLAGDANGVMPGTNFSVSVTPVAATSPTLVIAGFSRGPGNSVLLPNNTGTGIPVTLVNAPASTKTATFTLVYNAALLTITGPTSGNLVLNTVTSTPGVANFSFSTSTNVSTSSALLGNITANVPSSASSQYQAKALLDLPANLITIGGGSSPTFQSADGVEINAYLADVNGDHKIDGSDAGLVSAVLNAPNNAANQPAGFAAYRLADPALLGSPSSNPVTATPKITGTDVTLINRFAASLAPAQIPAPTTGLTYTSVGPDPSLSLPTDLHVNAGGTVTVPVNLDDARPAGSTGLTEATLALVYDPQVLTVSAGDIRLGTIPRSGSGWTLTSVVNATTGQLAITLESATPITSALGGSLVTIDFHLQPGAMPGATAVRLVGTVDPSGHALLQTSLFDSQGAFTLSPAPTNAADDPLAGWVVLPAPTVASAVGVAPAAADHPVLTEDASGDAVVLPAVAVTVAAEDGAVPETAAAVARGVPWDDPPAGMGSMEVMANGVAAQQAASLIVQLANPLSWSVPVAGAARLTDPWLPAMVRGKADLAGGTVPSDARDLPAGRFLLGAMIPTAPDPLDSLLWDSAGSDLDWLPAWGASPFPGEGRSQRGDRAAAASGPAIVVDRAALDQYFAALPDDPDQGKAATSDEGQDVPD